MKTKTVHPEKNSAPTRAEIIGLVGDIDDATVMAILRTGASYVEIEEAARWAGGEAIPVVEPAPLTGPAAAVYDILLADPTFAPADER